MIVRSYTGRTVPEALEKVRADLGTNALIIETRACKQPGLFGRQSGYEVVAAGEVDDSTAPPPRSRFGAEHARGRLPALERGSLGGVTAGQAQQLANARSADPETLHSLMERGELGLEIASIRRQLARLASGNGVPTDHLGPELSQLLEARELPDEIIAECDEVVAKAGSRIPVERLPELLARYLSRHLHCRPGLDWDRTRTLLMVGATGVGKTTSIAKLAGELVLKRRRSVGLITIDTYRVGAADQLQAYADLLDQPFAVARTPAELGAALQQMAHCDNVLVDTAGRSPADGARVHELKGFCRAAPGMTVALALSATAGRAEFASAVERFSLLPVEYVALTKLDECQAPGRLYGCLRRHRLEVAWCTTGQEVPDDIEAADAVDLAARVLRPAAAPVGS